MENKEAQLQSVCDPTGGKHVKCDSAFTIRHIPEEESQPQLIYILLFFLTLKKTKNKNKLSQQKQKKKQTVAALIP